MVVEGGLVIKAMLSICSWCRTSSCLTRFGEVTLRLVLLGRFGVLTTDHLGEGVIIYDVTQYRILAVGCRADVEPRVELNPLLLLSSCPGYEAGLGFGRERGMLVELITGSVWLRGSMLAIFRQGRHV